MAQYINREKLLKRMEGYCKANCGCKPYEDALCPSCGLGDAIYMVEEQRIVNTRNMKRRKDAIEVVSKTEKTTKPHGRLIDADQLKEQLEYVASLEWNQRVGASPGIECAIDMLDDAQTVIPASMEDE